MAETATAHSGETLDENLPSFIAPAYDVMAPRWRLCRDMMAGTEAVRAELDLYFPLGALETDDERAARAGRAELFPMFKETVKGLVGLALRKDPKLGDDVPGRIKDIIWENVDGAGTHGAVFAKRVFTDALAKGHTGILVDVPKVTSTRPLTIKEEEAIGLRPYWIHIKPEQIINWRTQTINGHVVLTLLVITEVVTVPLGDFGTQDQTRYRVFYRDDKSGKIYWEIWTKADDASKPAFDSDGELMKANRIPFVVIYGGERIAALQSVPPLLDLAYTNVAHVQVLSDLRSGLHAVLNAILCTKNRNTSPTVTPDPNAPGQSPENPAIPGQTPTGAPLAVGINTGIDVGEDGDVWYAEVSGGGIAPTQQELTNIENRGSAQGLSMLQRDVRQAQTAEAERMQRGEKSASLSTAARSLEDGLEIAAAFTALFMGEATGGTIEIDKTFEKAALDTARIDSYSRMEAAGQITKPTFWKMVREELPEDFNPTTEEQLLSQASDLELEEEEDIPGGGGNANTDTGGGSGGAE